MDYFERKIKEAKLKMEEAKAKGNYKLAAEYEKLISEIEAEQAYVMLEILNNDNNFGFGKR